ncbi:MAG: ABC transporter permease subunit [Leptospirales bacterium]
MDIKKQLSSLVTIKGDLPVQVKYGLYALYILLFVILWESAAGVAIRPFSEIFESLGVLWFEKGLAVDIGQSLQLNLVALASTITLTLITSYLSIFPFWRPIAFAISKGRFLGLLGLNFIFIELFGLGFEMKVALLTFGITVFYLTSMYSIVQEIPESKLDYARSLGLSKGQIVWQVVIRGTADQMLETLRQNAAIGWMMITAVEGIVKSGGIGDLLWNSNKHFDRGEVLAIIFCILAIGIFQDIFLKTMKKIITPHAISEKH